MSGTSLERNLLYFELGCCSLTCRALCVLGLPPRLIRASGTRGTVTLRFLARIIPNAGSGRSEFVLEMRSLARILGEEARNPKWTSYGALEVDVFAPSKADFHLFLASVEPLGTVEFSRDDLNEAPRHMAKEETIALARGYFNQERYWESHELFESVWRTLSGVEKSYVQGVILVCAAFVHEQKGERSVAMGIFRRSRKQLDYPADDYYGISVRKLAESVDSILATGEPSVFNV